MNLHELYHTGIVVRDIDQAMQDFTDAVGLRWLTTGSPVGVVVDVWTPKGTVPVPFRAAYSAEGPVHLELVEAAEGTLWSTAGGGEVHHLGYWSDDVDATAAELESKGFDRVASGGFGPDSGILWIYHQRGNGPYIEHVSRSLERYIFGGADWSTLDASN
jgi:hypothetical protein